MNKLYHISLNIEIFLYKTYFQYFMNIIKVQYWFNVHICLIFLHTILAETFNEPRKKFCIILLMRLLAMQRRPLMLQEYFRKS